MRLAIFQVLVYQVGLYLWPLVRNEINEPQEMENDLKIRVHAVRVYHMKQKYAQVHFNDILLLSGDEDIKHSLLT